MGIPETTPPDPIEPAAIDPEVMPKESVELEKVAAVVSSKHEIQHEEYLDKITKELPLPEGYRIPPGWQVSPKGTYKMELVKREGEEPEQKWVRVADSPILITARYRDLNTGKGSVRLSWRRDGLPKDVECDLLCISERSELKALANDEFPVNMFNSKDLVEYLTKLESLNRWILNPTLVTTQWGWQPGGYKSGFLLGNEHLTRSDHPTPPIEFRPKGDGESQWCDAIRTGGSSEVWVDFVNEELAERPLAIGAIYGSLAAPMVGLLDADNFIVNLAFTTSAGKSTALGLAESCWGRTRSSSNIGFARTWSAKEVGAERMFSLLNGLPAILDDTQEAENQAFIDKLVYKFSNGYGVVRGAVAGSQRTYSWSGVMLSSGENSIVAETTKGGVAGRVLDFWGPPMGEQSDLNRKLARKVQEIYKANYGHAGRDFVQYLLDHADTERKNWTQQYQDSIAYWTAKAGNNAVLGRLADKLAVLEVTGLIAQEALGLTADPREVCESLWEAMKAGTSSTDKPREALEAVFGILQSEQHRFPERSTNDVDNPPYGGWLGRWDETDWEYIAVHPQKLKVILRDLEHTSDSLLRQWKSKDWIHGDSTHNTKKVKLKDVKDPVRMVCIKKTALVELDLWSEEVEV